MMTIHARPLWLRDITEINVNAAIPDWLLKSKLRSWDYLIKSGMPTRKQERFKYTDFSFLMNKQYSLSQQKDLTKLSDFISKCRIKHSNAICLVIVNGVFQPALSDVAQLPDAIKVMTLADALAQDPELLQQQFVNAAPTYFAELNHALFIDGLFLQVADLYQSEQPIHVLSIITEQNDCLISPRHVFMIGKHANVTILEDYEALHANSYLHNVVTHWELQEGAVAQCYKRQHENTQASHYAHSFLDLRESSQFELVNMTTGGIFSRDDVLARLRGVSASCSLSGFYTLKQASQYVDHHIEIIHQAKNTNSEMMYKGILDHSSRAVFNGRLHVDQDAQRVNAYQANHHLLLSSEAEAYSKPELEIYADDVKCKHGATTGQLDENALFYLQSRGIEKKQAKEILMQGFAEEILKRISNPSLLAHMQEIL